MLAIDSLRHFTYLSMEVLIIGGVAFILWAFHFIFLWRRRYAVLTGTVIVTAYALPLDAFAVAQGWGGFNPAYVSGILLFWRFAPVGRNPLLAGYVFCDPLSRFDLRRA